MSLTSAILRQAMDEQLAGCDVAAGDVQQVFVVREEYDLGAVGQFGQHLQGSGGTSVVELDQDAVDDERQLRALARRW